MKTKYSKFICFVLSAVLMCTLTACGVKNNDNGKLKIVATLFPQYDFARQITGEYGEVTLLLTPGSESHTYEPTPKDILKIQNADIFLYVGGESEVWVDDVLKSVKNDNMKILRLMDYVQPVEEENDGASDGDTEYDEHIFTSLKNSGIILEEICRAVCEIDGENSGIYNKNAEKYAERLSALDAEFSDMIDSAKRKTVVFGDRFPFAYFARDYGLDCHAAFSGCSSETEASSATVSELINIVKRENIPVVFYIEFSSHSIADKIAEAAGVKIALLHSCHNISKADLENGVSYAELMEENYKNLSEALN